MLRQLPKEELTFSGTRKTVRSGHIPRLLQEYEITMTTEAGVFCFIILSGGSVSCFFPEMVYAGRAWRKEARLLHMRTPRSTQHGLMCRVKGGQIKTSSSQSFMVEKSRAEKEMQLTKLLSKTPQTYLLSSSASFRSSVKFHQACVLFNLLLFRDCIIHISGKAKHLWKQTVALLNLRPM